MAHPEFIYKVADGAVYEASLAAGSFVGQPVDLADGYIHFSTAAQLPETIRRYFAGADNQVLFQVAAAPLGPALKWEPSRGGELFPHLYGPLPMSEVREALRLDVPDDGLVALPGWVR